MISVVLVLMTGLLVSSSPESIPCTRMGEISPTAMVRTAHVIVRGAAVEYSKAPSNPNLMTTGMPDSIVRFKVVEVIKGEHASPELLLPGYLSDRDDFNDHSPPYTFVRPEGRAGSCFANTYRRGAEFLLMLKRVGDGLTVNWEALGPVNEQLRSADDPWLLWVRREAKR